MLREAVDSSNLSEKTKERLFAKIADVEQELSKPRSSLTKFWILTGAIGTAFAGTVTVLADGPKALETSQSIFDLVNEEKAGEQEAEQLLLGPPALQITDQRGHTSEG